MMRRSRINIIQVPSTSDVSESDNTGFYIIVSFAICVCCIFLSVSAGVAAYFLLNKKKEEAPFDKSLLEYRDKDGSHIISSLPFQVKDAYYLNMPVASGKIYTFTGKKCLKGVCDDVVLKKTPSMHLYYEDGNLLQGRLEYAS